MPWPPSLTLSTSGCRILACLVAANVFAVSGGAAPPAAKTSHARIDDGPLHAYVKTVSLPADGRWRIRDPESEDTIRELYLLPAQTAGPQQLGERMYAALEKRQIQHARWQLRRGYEASRQFAQENHGRGPKSIAQLASDKRWEYLARHWNTIQARTDGLQAASNREPPKGPFLHLIPEVHFEFAEPAHRPDRSEETSDPADTPAEGRVRRSVPSSDREPLAYELRPLIDDGKHWVLYTDGSCERIDINPKWVEAHKTKIRPLISRQEATDSEAPRSQYTLVLVSSEPVHTPLRLEAHNQVLGSQQQILWEPAKASEAPYAKLRDTIRDARQFAWEPYRRATDGGVLKVWGRPDQAVEPALDPRANLSMFSVLGGRAAIEETLQLQNLRVAESGERATIDVDSLTGVDVSSHPFDEMLQGGPGGSLEMARHVPHDRFFVYVGKPESIPALLDTGAPFVANLGTALTGNSLQYNLESRYLGRLGMTRDWVDAVLTSGLTSEVALFAPDLFFIDGTDLTIVARLRQPNLLRSMLGLLGASELSTESILELPTDSGNTAYLALRDDLLFASTHRGELQQSLDLLERRGAGSLGASSEFRYMLTKLPINEETRFYAYLSDPFVRRLVGPRVKIGQRRRMLAKAEMEALTAGAMLARLNGHTEPDAMETFLSDEPRFQGLQSEDLSIEANGLVSSKQYDTLGRMRTLPEVPLQQVTPEEAEAYRLYVENYSRFWRRFFDPIAVRLDEVGTDQLELSTFILPLVDNSIYNGLKSVLALGDDEPLSVPIVEPTPVLQFSVNLTDGAWQQIAGDFSQFFMRYSGASPAMLDDLGPSVHVAIFDADPIIAMGSGDIFGAFGGNVMRGGSNQMLMAPVALSLLTRPCSILVETKSPERTSQYLRQAASAGIRGQQRQRGFAVSFHQVDDRDQWVWTMNLFGVVKLRYGVEVVDQYLVIRNIPWSSDDRVISSVPANLNAALLQANPSACQEQLPGLFAAASDVNRQAVMSGLGRLYPFLLSGSANVEQAQAEHQRLFGFYPRQIAGDQWAWKDFRMVSDDYGEPSRQRQPAFDPDEPFGLMNRIDSLQLNMQFEEDGLRSSVRWRMR